MNKAVKVVVTIYLVLLAFVCIYVPWRTNFAIAQGTILVDSIGYSPIWAMHDFKGALQGATVDFAKVILEIVALTAVFGIPFMFVYKPYKYDYIDLEDRDGLPEEQPEHEEAPLEGQEH